MSVRSIIFLIGMALLGVGSAHAQFVPVVAKVRQTTAITRSGKLETTLKEGIYYRTSDGSVLQRWTTINGKATEEAGSLWNNVTGISYNLDFANRRAIFRAKGAPRSPELSPKNLVATQARPEISVSGVTCRLEPAKFAEAGKVVGGGQGCFSPENDLLVKNDITYRTLNGAMLVHIVNQLYDIQLGQEPDPNLFDIKKNFQVLMPEPQN